MKDKLNVVLFSGGTGTHSITEAFLKHPQIALTILINAYDDGHSTGRLRKFIPGMLGPSDVRKNIGRLMPRRDRCHRALQVLSDYRLPKGILFETALPILEASASACPAGLWPDIRAEFECLSVRQAARIAEFSRAFLDYVRRRDAEGTRFDFNDCALGNILFAGCFLGSGRDFNRTVRAFSEFYDVEAALLNITSGENLFLAAVKEDGAVLRGEADIVSAQKTDARIAGLYLLEEPVYRTRVENNTAITAEELRALSAATPLPKINPDAAAAIAAADVIIYGPGTQHSSLFPSYLTEGVGEAIAANAGADKIFIANIRRDYDIQQENVNDLARKFVKTLGRDGRIQIDWRSAVTHFFVQQQEASGDSAYVPFDPAQFEFPLDGVTVRDWEFQEGKHAGGYVLDELQQIVQSRIEISMQPLRYLVSIVVPALNEERTVGDALRHLSALDFHKMDLSKEIILVDGGSTDRTVEIAQSVRGVKVIPLSGERGRGAALRLGIAKARGDIVVFYPADEEYEARDIHTIVNAIVREGYRAVFGTRAVRSGLKDRLRQVYGRSWFLYSLSKYGGMLLSTCTLFLYNRYLSDTLTSVKGFDAKLLRSLELKATGIDLDMEIVAKLSRAQEYIVEVPVNFHPRTRAEGKKTTILDGFGAIAALLRYRFH
jgi:2-phospho-L-lactate transferase/gluconeogenesis factor (CofD/UPF0052 family)